MPANSRRDAAGRELFGRLFESRNRLHWMEWLSSHGDDGELALENLTTLVSKGVSRSYLVYRLMDLHVTDLLKPVSRRLAEQTLKHAEKLEPLVAHLESSRMREELGFVRGANSDAPRLLSDELAEFIERLQSAMEHANERENRPFDQEMSHIVKHVYEACGRHNDELLDGIISVIVGRPFSTRGWRKRHHSAADVSEIQIQRRPRNKVLRVVNRRKR